MKIIHTELSQRVQQLYDRKERVLKSIEIDTENINTDINKNILL